MPKPPPYAYVEIADELRRRIASGEITRKLPSQRELAERHSVSIGVTELTLRALKEEGLVESVPGVGWYVAGTVNRRTVAERLIDHVCTLAPGDMLAPEYKLAGELGVSRSALRTAIAKLEGQRILERAHNQRLVVRPLPRRQITNTAATGENQ